MEAACLVVITRSIFHVPAARMASNSSLRTLLKAATVEEDWRGTRSAGLRNRSRRENLHKAMLVQLAKLHVCIIIMRARKRISHASKQLRHKLTYVHVRARQAGRPASRARGAIL